MFHLFFREISDYFYIFIFFKIILILIKNKKYFYIFFIINFYECERVQAKIYCFKSILMKIFNFFIQIKINNLINH